MINYIALLAGSIENLKNLKYQSQKNISLFYHLQ